MVSTTNGTANNDLIAIVEVLQQPTARSGQDPVPTSVALSVEYGISMRSTAAIPLDTSVAIDQMMVDKFASMTTTERANLTAELNDMCTKLALAGIRAQHGELPDEEVRWHQAARRYGEDLATEAYGRGIFT